MMYMALSDTTVRLARATGTDHADGLALFVTAQGSKSWHFRFYWGGKQPRISLGIYPEISLRDARTRRDEARNLVAKGIDPRVHRRQERAAAAAATANTFEAVFRLWCDFKAKALTRKTGRQSTLSQINRDIESRRLLSLAMGNRGQRIPDWQLDPVRQELIQSVLQRAEGVDGWTLYHALSEPHEVLEGRLPVEAVTACNLNEVANAVFGALGLN
jgi:hypothetical protein